MGLFMSIIIIPTEQSPQSPASPTEDGKISISSRDPDHVRDNGTTVSQSLSQIAALSRATKVDQKHIERNSVVLDLIRRNSITLVQNLVSCLCTATVKETWAYASDNQCMASIPRPSYPRKRSLMPLENWMAGCTHIFLAFVVILDKFLYFFLITELVTYSISHITEIDCCDSALGFGQRKVS